MCPFIPNKDVLDFGLTGHIFPPLIPPHPHPPPESMTFGWPNESIPSDMLNGERNPTRVIENCPVGKAGPNDRLVLLDTTIILKSCSVCTSKGHSNNMAA